MRKFLIPLSLLFGFAVWIRNKLYKYEVINTKRLSCKVISIGNVSSGGTGKTPMVEYISNYFVNRGKSTAVVLKGYKRVYDDMKVAEFGYKNEEGKLNTENFGDEALMLLENLPETESGKGLLITSDDKIRGAKFADNKFKPDVVVIDDGFQLRKLLRDLDIVMVNPHEKKLLIPAGNFREPFNNVKRADMVIFNHKFDKNISLLHKGNLSSVLDCNYKLINFKNIRNEIFDKDLHKAIVFCGIGDPGSFRSLFDDTGIEILEFIKFPDHHSFTREDIEKIKHTYKTQKGDCILTTQKDFVRLKYPQQKGTELYREANELLVNYPLYFANIKLQILQNEEFLIEKLDNILKEIK
jgi:tetraacyldisaccharide 4'-kinase